jgi:eukaryotic-like serine/threonine-protein kinase
MTDASESRDVLLNRLAEEFATRQRAGERPRLEEYCDRHPHLADDIRSLFPALVELERARADAVPEPAVAVADTPPDTTLGDFRLLRELGRGGMGVVYEAEQVSLGRRVAIKLLPPSVLCDPAKRRRFEREARASARLHHTNIVPVHGFAEHDGAPYYVMQFIPGLGLDAVIDELGRSPADDRAPRPSRPRTGEQSALSVELARTLMGEGRPGVAPRDNGAGAPSAAMVGGASSDPPPPPRPDGGSSVAPATSNVYLPGQSGSSGEGPARKRTTYWESVARIGVQVAGALAYAHRLGVLHRDIKPSNLLLDLDGNVWVADFGLAKADDSDDLTRTGDLLGTLRYMPPEAFEGRYDARGDVYSLGLTLFELVALRSAYEERDRNRLILEVTTGDPPRLQKLRADAPRDLVTIVEKAINRDPIRRYQTAAALAEDLQRFLDGRPIAARRATELERLWMWARRRPAVAGLTAALFLCLLAGSAVSTVFAVRATVFARAAQLREKEATAARDEARRSAEAARQQEAKAEEARLEALDQAYLATRNEVRALRLARQPGWRAAALERLRGLVQLGSRNLDRADLRTEALACMAEMDVRLRSRFVDRDIGVWHVRFSPDGRALAVNDDKANCVYLRDLVADRELPSIPKSTGFAPFAFHPDGALAMPASAGRVAYHPLRAGQPTFPEIVGDGDALNLAFNRSGDRLAIVWGQADHKGQGHATRVRRVSVYATATTALLWSADLPPGIPGGFKVALAFSPDGQYLATPGPDRKVLLFSVGKDDGPVVLGTLDVRVCSIAFHPDGGSLAAAGLLTGAVWDLGSRSERFRIHSPEGGFWDVVYSLDGQLLAGACNDRAVRLWDARSGRELTAAVPSETGHACLSVAFSPEGDRLAAGGDSVAVFDVEGRRECRSETSTTNYVNGLAFDEAGAALHSCGGDRRIRTWDLKRSGARVLAGTGRSECPTVARLAPDGRRLAIGFSSWRNRKGEDFAVGVYRVDDPRAGRRLEGPKNAVFDLAFDPSGTRLAAACGDGGLYVWEFGTGVLQLRIGLAGIRAVRFLDGTHIFAAVGKRLVLLAATDGAVCRELTVPATVTAFVINRDREAALVGTNDATVHRVRLPELAIERSRAVADRPSELLMAAPPDGRVLAVTATGGPSNLLVDPQTLEPFARLPEKERKARCLAFDGTGRYVAFGGSQITLWDLTLVRDRLAPLGLAWDAAAPDGGSGADPASAGERPDLEAPPEFANVRGSVQSGVAAAEQGRFADAVVVLRQANE